MRNERDVWNTTYFDRAIRKKIGDALSAHYGLSQPVPDTIRTLLDQLDEPSVEDVTSGGRPLPHASGQ